MMFFGKIKLHFKGLYMGISVHPLHWRHGHTNIIMEDFGYLQIAEMLYCYCTSSLRHAVH